jgi:hypothetical protein
MTEEAAELRLPSIEYAETFIGECIAGDCGRPATVRVHENFVLCALHHLHYEVGQDHDEASIGLELVEGWRSIAAVHNNEYLSGLLGYAKDELLERKIEAERRQAQIDRAFRESEPNVGIRLGMSEAGKGSEEGEG